MEDRDTRVRNAERVQRAFLSDDAFLMERQQAAAIWIRLICSKAVCLRKNHDSNLWVKIFYPPSEGGRFELNVDGLEIKQGEQVVCMGLQDVENPPFSG